MSRFIILRMICLPVISPYHHLSMVFSPFHHLTTSIDIYCYIRWDHFTITSSSYFLNQVLLQFSVLKKFHYGSKHSEIRGTKDKKNNIRRGCKAKGISIYHRISIYKDNGKELYPSGRGRNKTMGTWKCLQDIQRK